jgi:hypothetical protein
LAFGIIGVAAVVERIGVVRIKPDRLIIILDGAVVFAFGLIGDAAVIERIDVVRIKPDCLVEIRDRAVGLALGAIGGAAIVERGCMFFGLSRIASL